MLLRLLFTRWVHPQPTQACSYSGFYWPCLHRLYSGFVNTFLQVFSHYTLGYLTLYSKFVHSLFQVHSHTATTRCALWPEASLPWGYWKLISMGQVSRLRVGSASPAMLTQQPACKLPAYQHKCSAVAGCKKEKKKKKKKSLSWKQAISGFAHTSYWVYLHFTLG